MGRITRARYLRGRPSPREIAHRFHGAGRGFHRLWIDLLRAELPRSSTGGATAIVLSHRRPFNTDLMVRSALLAREVQQVIVSNNDPAVELDRIVDVRHPRLILRNDFGINANRRYLLARDYGAAVVFAPDDDLFFPPSSIDSNLTRVLEDPTAPIGPQGQLLETGGWRGILVVPPERRADVLNRAYFCTGRHVRTALELADSVGLRPGTEAMACRPIDDVLISFGGETYPLVAKMDFVNCATATDPRISTYYRPGFADTRAALVSELRELRGWNGASAGGS